MQETISLEGPVGVKEGWLLQTSLQNWTNVVKNVSVSTVKSTLCEAGLYDRIAVKKSLSRKQNNVKRLQWAKVHKDWTKEQWNKVHWINESKFEIFGSIRIQRRVGEKAAIPCITPTVKYGGGCFIEYWPEDLFWHAA